MRSRRIGVAREGSLNSCRTPLLTSEPPDVVRHLAIGSSMEGPFGTRLVEEYILRGGPQYQSSHHRSLRDECVALTLEDDNVGPFVPTGVGIQRGSRQREPLALRLHL